MASSARNKTVAMIAHIPGKTYEDALTEPEPDDVATGRGEDATSGTAVSACALFLTISGFFLLTVMAIAIPLRLRSMMQVEA